MQIFFFFFLPPNAYFMHLKIFPNNLIFEHYTLYLQSYHTCFVLWVISGHHGAISSSHDFPAYTDSISHHTEIHLFFFKERRMPISDTGLWFLSDDLYNCLGTTQKSKSSQSAEHEHEDVTSHNSVQTLHQIQRHWFGDHRVKLWLGSWKLGTVFLCY